MSKQTHILVMVLAAMLAVMLPGRLSASGYLLQENFNSITSGIPSGWNNADGTTVNDGRKWTSFETGRTGRCLRFDSYNNSDGSTNMLKTPTLDLSQGGILSFWYKNPAGGDFSVYLSTDDGATYTTRLIKDLTDQPKWTYVELSISAAANGASAAKVVFKGTSNYGYGDAYIYLDDVAVMEAPQCATPLNIHASRLTVNSATIDWGFSEDGAMPSSYRIFVTDQDGAQVFVGTVPGGQSYTINGLQPNTTYNVELKGDCQDSYNGFAETGTFTFTTPCPPIAAPYTEDFSSPTLPDCVYADNVLLTQAVRYGKSGYGLTMNIAPNASSYIAFPELTIPSDSVEVDFFIRARATDLYRPKFMVGLVPEIGDITSSFEPLYMDSLVDTEWKPVHFNTQLTGYGSQPTARICIFVQSGGNNACHIDNVDIHYLPSCVRPENLRVAGFSSSTVSLSYNTTNATTAEVMVIAGTDTTYQSLTGNPCVVAGLNPDTEYEFRLRGNCGNGDYSAWTYNTVTARTTCDAATSTYFNQDFENISNETGAPSCWTQGWISKTLDNKLNYGFVPSAVAHSGTQGMAMAKQTAGTVAYLSSQAFPVTTAGTHDVSLWVKRDNAPGFADEQLEVWLNNAPYTTVGGTKLGTISRNYLTAPAEFEPGWFNYTYPINVTGTYYVVIVGTSQDGAPLIFDDVAVIDHVTCTRVTGLSVTQLGGDDGLDWTIDWDANGKDRWQVDYIVNGDTATSAVTTPQFVLSLEPNTAYNISLEIRAVCAPGDTSAAMLYQTSFTTPCAAVKYAATGFEEDEFPASCWKIGTTNRIPSRGSYYAHTGNNAIEFPDQQSPHSSWLISPLMNFNSNDPDSTYFIEFWFARTSYGKANEGLEVYVSPSENYSDGTRLTYINRDFDRDPVERASGMYSYTLNVPDSITGFNYVIFRYVNQYGTGGNVDDIVIGKQGSCPPLKYFNIDGITNRTATVSLDSIDGRIQVVYGPQGTAPELCTKIDTTGSACKIALTGLAGSSDYSVYLRRICAPGDTSDWSPAANFTSQCDAEPMPFFTDAESEVFPPACWQIFTTGKYLPERVSWSSYASSGEYIIMFPDQQSGNNSMLTTPLTTFDPDSTYIVSFSASRESTDYMQEGMYVYVSDKPDDISPMANAVLVASVPRNYTLAPVEATTGRYDYTFNIPAGTGGDKYVIFCYVNQYGSSMKLDDITVGSVNACYGIKGHMVATTENSATIAVDGNYGHWQVAYGIAGTPRDSMTIEDEVGSVAHTINGLQSETAYECYVRRVCHAGDTSVWCSNAITFNTTGIPYQLPFVCGFESQAENDKWTITNDNANNQLVIGHAATAVGADSSALYVESADRYAYNTGINTNSRAYTLLHFDADFYQMQFQWRCTGGESSYDYGRVLLIPGSYDPSTITGYNDAPAGSIEFGRSTNAAGIALYNDHRLNMTPGDARGWNYVSDQIDMRSCAGNYYLVVFWRNNNNSAGAVDPLSVDNFRIVNLTCANPAITVSGITSTAATLNYSLPGATGYEVIVSDQSINTDEITAASTYLYRGTDATGHVTVTGLAQNTPYYYVLRTICQNGDTAVWTSPELFITRCSSAMPYLETFEDQAVMNCWTSLPGNTEPERSTTAHYQGNASIKISGTQAVSPEMLVDSLNHYMVTGYVMAEQLLSEGAQLDIGLVTDPAAIETFENFATYNIPRAKLWYEFTVFFNGLDDDDYADFRTARNIVFSAANGQTLYLDNIQVMEVPACPKPSFPEISNETPFTFDLAFTDNAAATAWSVMVNGQQQTVTTNPVTITGLTAHTVYDVYVAAICAPGDTSDYAYCGRTTTACDTMTMPFKESFETIPYYQYVAGSLESICWNHLSPTNAAYYADNRYQSDGSQSLELKGASDGNCIILPPLRGLKNCEITFSTVFESYDGSGNLQVGYITDPTDLTTFVQLGFVPKTSGKGNSNKLVMQDMIFYNIPDGARLAFYYIGGHNAYYMWLDNVRVTALGNCPSPFKPELTNIGATTAQANFTDTCATHTAWEYTIGPDGFNPNDTAYARHAISAKTFSVTGLTPNTEYNVAIRAICDDEPSPWVVADFRSACDPFVVTVATPFFDDFEDQGDYGAPVAGCYQLHDVQTNSSPKMDVINGQHRARFDNNSVQPNGAAISREFYLETGHRYEASIMARSTNYTSKVDIFLAPQFQMEEQSMVASGAVYACNDDNTCYREVYGYFTVPETGVYTIGVRTSFYGYTGWAVAYYDNFSVKEYTCPELRNTPVASQPTSTTANVSVNMFGYDEAEIGWAPAVGAVSSVFIDGTTTTTDGTCIATGLTPSTGYAFFYRIICAPGDTSAWSPASAVVTTLANDCYNLQNVGAHSVSDSSITFNWRAQAGTVSVQYEFSTGGAVIDSGNTTGSSLTFTGLTPATAYTLRVRGICSATDTSAWVSAAASTAGNIVTAPLVCDFEDATLNREWTYTRSEGSNNFVIGTAGTARNGGSYGLYVSNNGSAHQYNHGSSRALAYLRVSFAPGDWMIKYDWKSAGENGYDGGRLFLVPDDGSDLDFNYSTLPAGAISIEPRSCLVGNANWRTSRYTYTNNGTEPRVYRLVAAWVNNASGGEQPPLALDNISITSITCAYPRRVNIASYNVDGATAIVTRADAATPIQYAVSASAASDDATVWTTINTVAAVDTIDITGLNTTSSYYLLVRHACDAQSHSPEISTPFFTRAAGSVTIPYFCGFENDEDLSVWRFENDRNHFMIGTAASYTGDHSIYITNNDDENVYDNTYGTSFAIVPLAVTQNAKIEYSFDWRCEGESSISYGRAFIAPATATFTAGRNMPAGVDGWYVPAGYIALDLNHGGYTLVQQSSWNHQSGTFSLNPGMYQLVLCWHNMDWTPYQPPVAIDNIRLTYNACPKLTVGNTRIEWTSDNSCVLKVFGNNENATLRYQVASTNAFTDTLAAGISSANDDTCFINLANLDMGTRYWVRLVSVCDLGEESDPYVMNFSTGCVVNNTYPWSEDFETMAPLENAGTLAGSCWTYWSRNRAGNATVRSTIDGNGPIAGIANSGTQSLLTFNGTQGTTTLVTALPLFTSLNGKWFGFSYRKMGGTYAQANSTVDYGYLSQPEDASTFVSLGSVELGNNWNDLHVQLAGLPDTTRLAIKTRGQGFALFDDFVIHDIAATGHIYNDTICNSDGGYYGHGFNVPVSELNEGQNVLTRYEHGAADTLITVNLERLAKIETHITDITFTGRRYTNGIWDIASPRAKTYQYTYLGGSRNGCDSTVYLTLDVMPASNILRDTICSGGSYLFGDTTLTTAGMYSRTYPSQFEGYNVTDTLYLHVMPDTVPESVTVCQYDLPYEWNGQSLNAAGIYSAVIAGARGCDQTHLLTLNVINMDSTINVSICRGGQTQVVDTTLTTAGTYTLRRLNANGCDVVYHITAVITDPQVEDVYDMVCEGKTYRGYGLTLDLTGDTVVTINTRTADAQCDSIAMIHIEFHPTQHTTFTVAMYTGETYEWEDVTYTEFGQYSNTFQDQYGCDSVATLNLVCKDDVENVADNGRVRVVPNPAHAGQAALVFVSGTGEIARVEVINSFGAIIDTWEPTSTPIDLAAPTAAGIYHVRVITRDGRVYVEKLIVK